MAVIAHRYQTLERLGGGGMADVFRAHDATLDRDVALKLLRPVHVDDREFVERFRREAEALSAIDHPGIVRVLDWGTSEDGPYIAMELVTGGTLRDIVRRGASVPPHRAATIAAAIADALEAAHLRGVLHRDLKPDNILMDEDGRPKLADFGIAQIAAATAITRTGEMLGTPRYLAPEQMIGDVVDERADVYALGVILYEMLTGVSPTGGSTASEIVSRRLRGDPVPPRRLVAIPAGLDAVVMRALARDPAQRFARARDLRAALLPFTTAPVERAAAPVTAPAFVAAAATGPRRRRAGAPLAAVLALLVLLVGAGAALAASRAVRQEAPVAVSPAGSATPSPTVAAATSTPVPTSEPTPEPTIEPTPEPTTTPAPRPTAAPTAAGTVAGPVLGAPAAVVSSFYSLVSAHDYANAAALWSDRMKASYPPATNIWGRFDNTRSVSVTAATVRSISPTNASVAVSLAETLNDGTVRHYAGTWYLVNVGGRWLMDQPSLYPV